MNAEHKSLENLKLPDQDEPPVIVLDLCVKNDWFKVPYSLLSRIREYGLKVEGFHPDVTNQGCIQLELAVFNEGDIRDIEAFVINEDIIIADWHWSPHQFSS